MVDGVQRALTASPGPKPVAVGTEVHIKDQLDHHPDGGLHHAVPYRGDSARTLPAPGFPDHDPFDRLALVSSASEFLAEFRAVGFQVCSKGRDGLTVTARTPLVLLHLGEGGLQGRDPPHLVRQAKPFVSCDHTSTFLPPFAPPGFAFPESTLL